MNLNIDAIETLTKEVSDSYATIKASLEQRGINLPDNDLWMSAVAQVNNLTIVTTDVHFRSIPDIPVDDWSSV